MIVGVDANVEEELQSTVISQDSISGVQITNAMQCRCFLTLAHVQTRLPDLHPTLFS